MTGTTWGRTVQASQQPRERAVPCAYCHASTWNTTAICDPCVTLYGIIIL